MEDRNIKVIFQVDLEEDVITWENHVNEIMAQFNSSVDAHLVTTIRI